MHENDQTSPRALQEVFSALSCQLREELANVYAAMQLLAPPALRSENAELDGAAAMLSHGYFRILRMVDTLSLLSEPEGEPLPAENADLPEIVRDLCREVEPMAEAMGITMTFSCSLRAHLAGVNVPALRRICLHLLSNAMKFTPKGGKIDVSLRVLGTQILLSVADTGCGIPAERQETLFDPMPTLPDAPTQKSGLGLGLPLCQHLARALGGRLILQSDEGRGTTVSLSLPDKRAKNVPAVRSALFDYTGGFNQTLLELSDALPYTYFTQKHLD